MVPCTFHQPPSHSRPNTGTRYEHSFMIDNLYFSYACPLLPFLSEQYVSTPVLKTLVFRVLH